MGKFLIFTLACAAITMLLVWLETGKIEKSELSEHSISGQAEVFWGKTPYHNYPPGLFSFADSALASLSLCLHCRASAEYVQQQDRLKSLIKYGLRK
jgi:hypothetical protein